MATFLKCWWKYVSISHCWWLLACSCVVIFLDCYKMRSTHPWSCMQDESLGPGLRRGERLQWNWKQKRKELVLSLCLSDIFLNPVFLCAPRTTPPLRTQSWKSCDQGFTFGICMSKWVQELALNYTVNLCSNEIFGLRSHIGCQVYRLEKASNQGLLQASFFTCSA